jgi:tetratricopeptide (TPR) repeat protein
VTVRELGELQQAKELFAESLTLLKAQRDVFYLARALGGMAIVALIEGDWEVAWSLLESSATTYRICGNKRGMAWCFNSQGCLLEIQSDYRAAQSCFEEALALFRLVEDYRWTVWVLHNLGKMHVHLGEPEKALACREESIRLGRAIGLTQAQLSFDIDPEEKIS